MRETLLARRQRPLRGAALRLLLPIKPRLLELPAALPLPLRPFARPQATWTSRSLLRALGEA
jgi:hypothetical protein